LPAADLDIADLTAANGSRAGRYVPTSGRRARWLPFEKELERFFVNYHEFVGKSFRVLTVKGPAQALRQVKACRKTARRKNGW